MPPITTTVPKVLNEVLPGATNAKEAIPGHNKIHAVVFCALLLCRKSPRVIGWFNFSVS